MYKNGLYVYANTVYHFAENHDRLTEYDERLQVFPGLNF